MDPVSQGAVGAAFSQSTQAVPSLQLDDHRDKIVALSWLGCLAGMAPDLDVFIQSPTDPLLFLEFHRHFTHALIFIPFGALVVSGVLYRAVRYTLRFKEAYLACLVGYATHGLLDACTSYGTQLFWPFADTRVAWNNVSVVDPALTIPLLALVITGAVKRNPRFSVVGIAWMFAYLLLGVVQMNRAIDATHAIAAQRGHTPSQVTVKASFANLIIWKSIYRADAHYFVDAVRTGGTVTYCPGDKIERLDVPRHLPYLDPISQQARDVERFRWFSDNYLAVWGTDVIDIRYSIVPNQVDPMWGIRLNPNAGPGAHVEWFATRETDSTETDLFWRMLTGAECQETIPPR